MESQATEQKYITADDIPDLYRKYLKEILSFIYGYVRDAEETKDLAQDVFYKLWKDVEKKKIPDVNIRGYIYKIAQNHCIDTIRKKKIATTSIMEEYLPEQRADSMEDQIIDSLTIQSVYDYIHHNLSETESTVFKLKYLHKLKLEEISEIVETSISSLSRILQKITAHLGEKFPDILRE